MRAAPAATARLRIPSRTHSARSRAAARSASAAAGGRPVPVFPLGADVVDVARVGDRGEAPVRLHADVVAGDVVARQVRVDGQVDGDLDRLGDGLALELGDGLGDHLAVEVEADGGDVARLVGAEQVAGAADLEVAHGDLEPGAEVGELADGLEPLVGLLGERPVRGMEQVRVGRAGRGGRCGPAAGRAAPARAGRRGRRRGC